MSVVDEPVVCDDERARRAALLGHPTLNGIDYLEVDATDPKLLHVCVPERAPRRRLRLPGPPRADQDRRRDAHRRRSRPRGVAGGRPAPRHERRPGRRLLALPSCRSTAARARPALRPHHVLVPAGLPDRPRRRARRGDADEPGAAPALDYMAKDYASFRQLMLDLLPQLNPRWRRAEPVPTSGSRSSSSSPTRATGSPTSRTRSRTRRSSRRPGSASRVRRHARLVDYRMHDGANAQAVVHAAVKDGAPGDHELPAGSKAVTRIVAPLRGDERPPGAVLDWDQVTAELLFTDPALAGAAVFETLRTVQCREANNEIALHTWGNEECRLPAGRDRGLALLLAGRDDRRPAGAPAGDLLLSRRPAASTPGSPATPIPRTGRSSSSSRSPTRRPTSSSPTRCSTASSRSAAPATTRCRSCHVRWRREDALAFPLWLSRDDPDRGLLRAPLGRARQPRPGRPRPDAARRPTCCAEPARRAAPACGLDRGPAHDRQVGVGRPGRPPASSRSSSRERPTPETWRPVPDLLDSPPFDADFVAEVGRRRPRGPALRRRGVRPRDRRRDRHHGHATASATARVGNVGAEALVAPRAPAGVDTSWIDAAQQPAPRDRRARARVARGGARAGAAGLPGEAAPRRHRRGLGARRARGPGRRRAPWRASAGRAAGTRSSSGSTRSPRRTSSPRPDGRIGLEPGFEARVRAHLTRFRLAGYDLELRPPTFVPLELEIEICVGARPLPLGRRPGGRRGALGEGARRRPARLLPPGAVHVRPGRLPEPDLRGGRGASKASTRRSCGSSAATAARTTASSTSGVLPTRRGRDRAARRRPELRRARRAPGRRRGRQGMSCRADTPAGSSASSTLPARHLRDLPPRR